MTNNNEFQLTKVGLPNSCWSCGTPLETAWYARNEDEARSGKGRCAKDAGYSPAKAAPKRGRPRKQKAGPAS